MDENGFSDLGKCPSSELRKLHILRLWNGDSKIDTEHKSLELLHHLPRNSANVDSVNNVQADFFDLTSGLCMRSSGTVLAATLL
jgi:hypothetical protein